VPTDPLHLPPDAAPRLSADLRLLRILLVVGTLAVAAIWALESAQQVIAPWDRVAYPVLILLFGGCAVALFRWPERSPPARALACIGLNGYLVMSLLCALFVDTGMLNMYTLATAMFWIPLGYSTAFVFLDTTAAVAVSAAAFLTGFVPIATVFVVAAPARWGAEFPALAVNMALAQLIYVVVLTTTSRLRAGYHRARERIGLMQILAGTDALTGLSNRRALNESLAHHVALARRSGSALSVILIDVDHFKQINDRHGHPVGDLVLTQLARVLESQVRVSDRMGRWGGEEFLVVAPGTGLVAVTELAERIRIAVAAFQFEHGRPVTLSLGLTQMLQGDEVEAMLQRADRALYRAKQRGRNRVESQAVAAA
jgi:diguanylate cyclase (GGDEF)-like protein